MSPLQVVVTQTPSDYDNQYGVNGRTRRSKDTASSSGAGTPSTEIVEEDLGVDFRRSSSMPDSSSDKNPQAAAADAAAADALPLATAGSKSKAPFVPTPHVDTSIANANLDNQHGVTPFNIPLKVDKYGFITNMDAQGHIYDDALEDDSSTAAAAGVPPFAVAQQTLRREKKWNQTMNSWNNRRPKVTMRRLRKGVPDSVRGRVWAMLGGGVKQVGLYDEITRKTANVLLEPSINNLRISASNSSLSSKSAKGKKKKKQHKSDANISSDTADPYVQTKAFQDVQNTIERDIHRTFPRHTMFYEDENSSSNNGDYPPAISPSSSGTPDNPLLHGLCDPQLTALISTMEGEMNISPSEGLDLSTRASFTPPPCPEGQVSLRRVLRAYSYYDREIGYCQGMNFIAGMFLTVMPEEDAFWLLVAVMNDEPCKMRGLYGEGMRETHTVLHVAEMLIAQFLPRLAKHFDREHIHVTMYATQWLLTQFTSSFQFDLVTRVWDCFLGEGWKAIYRVMLALLQQYQTQLLKMTFEDILAFFRELPSRVDGATIIDVSLKIPLRKAHIAKYEREWLAKQQQQEQQPGR